VERAACDPPEVRQAGDRGVVRQSFPCRGRGWRRAHECGVRVGRFGALPGASTGVRFVRACGCAYLARGAGADLAGQYNNLQQVPLPPEEVGASLARATRRLPASGSGFEFKGEWVRPEEESDGVFVSTDPRASMKPEFDGPLAVLVHSRTPQRRLVRVAIDDREYPPVDMSGKANSGVRTCLAVDLAPGSHKLQLRPPLPWRSGTMSVLALEVSALVE